MQCKTIRRIDVYGATQPNARLGPFNLDRARTHSPPPNGGALVYGGTDYQEPNGTWVLPPERLPDLLAPLAGA